MGRAAPGAHGAMGNSDLELCGLERICLLEPGKQLWPPSGIATP